jgi:hypothetical protein
LCGPSIEDCGYVYGFRWRSGRSGGAGVAEAIADAAGVVGEGAVADWIDMFGVPGGVSPARIDPIGCPNIRDIRLLNIPILKSYAFAATSGCY